MAICPRCRPALSPRAQAALGRRDAADRATPIAKKIRDWGCPEQRYLTRGFRGSGDAGIPGTPYLTRGFRGRRTELSGFGDAEGFGDARVPGMPYRIVGFRGCRTELSGTYEGRQAGTTWEAFRPTRINFDQSDCKVVKSVRGGIQIDLRCARQTVW